MNTELLVTDYKQYKNEIGIDKIRLRTHNDTLHNYRMNACFVGRYLIKTNAILIFVFY